MILELNPRRNRKTTIWLALLGLGSIIGLNLALHDGSPAKSATEQQPTATANQPEQKPEPVKPKPVTPPVAMPALGTMISKIPQKKPTVYLTFDDGPGKYTKDMVAVLDKYHVKGTFFWIGDNLNSDDKVAFAQKMAAEGHIIGTHTMHHQQLRKNSKEAQIKLITDSTTYVSSKVGIPIYYFRPPYGAIDQNSLLASREANQRFVYWSVDSLDWKHPNQPDIIMKNITSEVRPGAIILMHEKQTTLHMLPAIIDMLQKKGYQLEPLPQPAPATKA
ncbi:polysaccharide deacetylase family protein [Aneurinibacillus soli]|uniref:polysaccharide deacetylase family protein n=1 Tax=Aneurinibacillus soli TaxID=1500254 RepID=UPI0012FD5E78|nr:polysaccharide deacetylase family protein [Aneurinibacillus soli]